MKKSILLAALLYMLSTAVVAEQERRNLEIGKAEFERSCAICHGLDGRGNGEMAEVLKVPPSNLTILAQHNNGYFPYLEVYQSIEGSGRVGLHGSRQMPVWGDRYRAEAEILGEERYLYTRGLILELINYLMSIQVK